jgi:hypothetical protein
MIKHIIEMLGLLNHYNQSETIEIAKGKYHLPKNYKGWVKKIKRKINSK